MTVWLVGLLAAALLVGPLPLRAQLYVPNQDDATVSVIDPATLRLLRTVDLRRYGVGDNAKPHHVQVEPDGSAWYVTLIGAGKVLKLDRANIRNAVKVIYGPGTIKPRPTARRGRRTPRRAAIRERSSRLARGFSTAGIRTCRRTGKLAFMTKRARPRA